MIHRALGHPLFHNSKGDLWSTFFSLGSSCKNIFDISRWSYWISKMTKSFQDENKGEGERNSKRHRKTFRSKAILNNVSRSKSKVTLSDKV